MTHAELKELKTQLQELSNKGFIRLSSFRRFVQDFSKVAVPLIELTRKGEPFIWMVKREQGFQKLKKRLTIAPILALPDGTEGFSIKLHIWAGLVSLSGRRTIIITV